MEPPEIIIPYDKSEREFLHDLANPLAVVYGHLRIMAVRLEEDLTALKPEEVLEKVNKVIKSFDKANHLLDRRRSFLKGGNNP